ncbi:ATP-dependent DNA ligase [Glaciihabitans arcticus]|uniref:ATP-dependent DNA ligase n=1 Tax=Glaciihabitans arcticus TaxID=2668039 RepID=A0A4Q9GVA9_9MICO|nr:ATP-dependent DNA ligase [Glaciihabitans arcticus]TBN56120.1 ATP-dependent DNA ligase [Glaciihabitans arcticus]
MGTLLYGSSGIEIDFDDRALAHLQVAITAKLRRNESFTFSWVIEASAGGGRNAVWLHPAVPLFYRFRGTRQPSINPDWVDQLLQSANRPGGMVYIDEPTGAHKDER